MSDDLVKKQHPDLIELSPNDQLKKLPPLPKDLCGRRNKSCQVRSGGCGYRFPKGYKGWVCPKCGQDRRCYAPAVEGSDKCRMHGGAKGSGDWTKGGKAYLPPDKIKSTYNSVLRDPELLTLTHEIALITAYTEELFGYLKEHDIGAAHTAVRQAAALIQDAATEGNLIKVRKALHAFNEAIDPITINFMTWNTIKDNFMVQRAMIDTAQKWINQKKESMPREQVVEVLLWWNRIALKYIRNERDRQSYGKEVLRLLPKDDDEF